MHHLELAFVKRIELAEALSCRECAEVLRSRLPDALVAVEEIAGGIAVFTGVDSPITQAIGAGLNGTVTPAEFDRLEEFFLSRGAPAALEVCPFAHPTLVELLSQRPYRLAEFSNVLAREMCKGEVFPPPAPGVVVRFGEADDARLYGEVVTKGFAEHLPVSQQLLDVVESSFNPPGGRSVLAVVDGRVVGGATVTAHGPVTGMSGAATLPGFRRRGVQTALLCARLAWAAQRGGGLAFSVTQPGSASQRNLERAGFRVVYSRTKLVRAAE